MSHELLGYDTETTSNQPSTTRVVQLAALRRNLKGEISTVFNQLCNPGCDISDGAKEIHGISTEMVRDAEPDHEAMKRFYAYVFANKDEIIIVGHNIVTFDLTILWNLGGPKIPILFIDTFVAATRVFPESHSHKLADLVQWLELGDFTKAHDAEADIKMVFLLCDYIFNGLKHSDRDRYNWTYKDFAEWCMRPRVLKRAHFGKHHGKLWGKPLPGESRAKYVPESYIRYICDKWEDPSPDMIETIWQKYRYRFKKLARRRTANV
jgi:DNA polymerase III alpha subunit (gram-positive type)